MRVSESDPRSTRTRLLLHSALMKLGTRQGFSGVTVQEVTRAAGVNRTTFYLHYAGLHELMEDCARSLFEQMRAEIYSQPLFWSQQNLSALEPFVLCVFRHLENHAKFYRVMLGRQGDPLFRSLFQELLSELIFEPINVRNQGNECDPNLEMTVRFFSSGFTGIATWWLEKDMPISAEQASRQVVRDLLPDYLKLMEKLKPEL